MDSHNSGDNGVENGLYRAWLREQAYHVMHGGTQVILWIVFVAGIEFGIDWTWSLPERVRSGMLVGNVVGLVVLLYKYIWQHLCRYDPLRQALREEASDDGLRNLLVSYCQLDEDRAEKGMSRDMIRMIRRRAEAKAANREFGQYIHFSDLIRPVTFALVVLTLVVAGGVWRPAESAAFLQRIWVPGSKVAYPSDTHLHDITGDLLVRRHDTVTLAVRASGQVPDRGRIFTRRDDGNWRENRISRSDDHRFVYESTVSKDFSYYFQVGDAQSAVHRVKTEPPPKIVQASIRLEYPSYTGMAPSTEDEMNVEMPEGTRIRWNLELDRPVTDATLVPAEGEAISARVSDGGTRVRAEHTADASLSYRFQFDWTLEGEELTNETARHFIQVIPDRPPRVMIQYPPRSGKATLSKKLNITFSANDDHGISGAHLIYALNEGRERKRELDVGKTVSEKSVTVVPAELIPDLKKGDVFRYRIDVTDNRQVANGPQRTSSREMQLQFVSPQTYLEDLSDRRSQSLGRLRPIYRQERNARENLRTLTPGKQEQTMEEEQ